jgi:hypothetical protein
LPVGLAGLPLTSALASAGNSNEAERSQFSFYRFDKMSRRRAFSLQNESMRVIHERPREGEAARDLYYDLRHDPYELQPIEQPDAEAKNMMTELLERIEAGDEAAGSTIDIDANNYERLKALGYVE